MSEIKNQIKWVVITKDGEDDPTNFHIQQIQYLGKNADTLMIEPYGLHSNVPPGAFGVMLSIQGNPDNRGVIAWTPKERRHLESGEVSFYHPPTDAFITWKANGDLDIETGGGGTAQINIKAGNINIEAEDITVIGKNIDITADDVLITSPLTKITGDLEVTGSATLGSTVTSNGTDISDSHTHPQGNDSDGDTEVDTGPPV